MDTFNFVQINKSDDKIRELLSYSKDKNDLNVSNYKKLSTTTQISKSPLSFLQEKAAYWLKAIFLPEGYPHSVSDDYLQYQIWDSLQAYCSNVAGALSLHATLVSIGVGQDAASPLAAAISWLTRDGAGMVTSITFAYFKSYELDSHPKQWRVFADISNDASLMLRLTAPLLPPSGTAAILATSAVLGAMVGVSGPATRASIVHHQALCNNMADVSAKDGSQETLVNLAGLLTSLTLLPYLTSSLLVTWVAFFLLVCVHIWSNVCAVRSVRMRTINAPRLRFLVAHFLRHRNVADIALANSEEPIFTGAAFRPDYLSRSYRVTSGASLERVYDAFSSQSEGHLFAQFLSKQSEQFFENTYMIFVNPSTSRVYLVFTSGAQNIDIVRAYFAAHFLVGKNDDFKHLNENCFVERILQLKGEADAIYTNEFLPLLNEKGWKLDPLRLRVGGWRLSHAKEE